MSSDEAIAHSILYAKGHYQHDEKLTGLRVLAGHYSLMDPEYIDDMHLMQYALMLLEKYPRHPALISDTISDIFRETWKWRRDERGFQPNCVKNITMIDVVEYVMSQFRYMKVDQLPPLPKADASIYPLRDKD